MRCEDARCSLRRRNCGAALQDWQPCRRAKNVNSRTQRRRTRRCHRVFLRRMRADSAPVCSATGPHAPLNSLPREASRLPPRQRKMYRVKLYVNVHRPFVLGSTHEARTAKFVPHTRFQLLNGFPSPAYRLSPELTMTACAAPVGSTTLTQDPGWYAHLHKQASCG